MSPTSRRVPRSVAALAVSVLVLLAGGPVAGVHGASAATVLPHSPSNLPAAVEALQPYVGQSTCDPVAKPGVRAFSNLLLDTYTDTTSLGIVRDCGIGGQSEHKEGRAWDWGVSAANAKQTAEVNVVMTWLLKTDSAGHEAAFARRFGIMYIIWNKRIWKAYEIDKGWQPYSGHDEHTGHVHFSFGWSGAKMATSWWTGKVAPTDYGTGKAPDLPVTPQRLPTNLLVLATYGSTTLQQPAGANAPRSTADPAATTIVQKALRISADGDYGPATAAAVGDFEGQQNLPVDGIVSPAVWTALFPRPQDPFGKLETVTFGLPGTVSMAGWAADADTEDPLHVHVYVDGRLVTALVANGSRPEIAARYPGVAPELGFTYTLTLPEGSHQVCAYAINSGTGSGNRGIGCQTVNVQHRPFGHLDKLSLTPSALVSSGWVYDPDVTDVVQVTHTLDGTPMGSVAANRSRPDVGAKYPAYGNNRGYASTLQLAAVPEGSHTLCAVAGNVGAGTDTTLGCVTGTVRHTPFGSFDLLAQSPTGLVIQGWAVEPDSTVPATVTGTLDGRPLPAVTAAIARSDIARRYPLYGAAHGFRTTLPLPAAGRHTVCLITTNVGAGAPAAPVCKSVTVVHQPLGRFELATTSHGQVTVQGWALDSDTTKPITIHVRSQGALIGHVTASGNRPDVATSFPGYGAAHGFRYTAPTVLTRGGHTICVYAINAGAGVGNSSLGCRKVTVG